MRRMNAALLAALLSLTTTPAFVSADPLPGTQTLTDSRDLARVMVDGIHAYLDRELKEAPKKRDELWKAKANEPMAAKRERLKKLLGVVDERLPRDITVKANWGEGVLITPTDRLTIYNIQWDVTPGLISEGLLIRGKGNEQGPLFIVVPDSSQNLDEYPISPNNVKQDAFLLQLVNSGCDVILPRLINREDTHSGNARLKRFTNQSHREFVHRMAYEMGRTSLALDIQQILTLLPDPTATDHKMNIIGFGDGGRIALYAAALDERIGCCHIAGAFGPQESLWQAPIDRNIWGLLNEFGDAEVASMIAPRKLIIDPVQGPTTRQPENKPGRSGATPGMLKPFTKFEVTSEFDRLKAMSVKHVKLMELGEKGINIDTLLKELKTPEWNAKNVSDMTGVIRGKMNNTPDKTEILQKRLLDRQVNFVQNLWRNSEPVRKEFWKKADASSPEVWEKSCDWYREYFHDEIIGRLPKPTMPLNPKSRLIYDTPKWTGHEVTLDVFPDVMAYGILLLPKDMKPGEKRPVVVCQHGLEGRPTDVCNPKERTKYYLSFGAQLADKGYIVFAPQNPYIFDDHFRQILRKANPLKLSLFSFIIRQHERILDWLETQPHVDPKRIAFYGLSYGGKTAMRVPAVEKRYCLSICSGDFNEWIGKIVSMELPMSYMYTKEYDMLEFNLGHTFNYAEMSYMIAPRPFMVERGHDDGVGTDEMVAYEYAKVRYLYANKLKIPDRTDIEFFPGGHQINGKGTFDFLQKHLVYPK
jgi:dienelactone hydrolase